jgi:hypothetical protein
MPRSIWVFIDKPSREETEAARDLYLDAYPTPLWGTRFYMTITHPDGRVTMRGWRNKDASKA